MSNEQFRSRRTLSLRFDIPILRTQKFWNSLKDGRLITTKCKICGKITFPPQTDCPDCMSGEHEWIDLGSEVELVTFTHVQVTPTSFLNYDPYIVAIGKLPNGQKVLAWVEGVKIENLKPGDKLKIKVKMGDNGNPYYIFAP